MPKVLRNEIFKSQSLAGSNLILSKAQFFSDCNMTCKKLLFYDTLIIFETNSLRCLIVNNQLKNLFATILSAAMECNNYTANVGA